MNALDNVDACEAELPRIAAFYSVALSSAAAASLPWQLS